MINAASILFIIASLALVKWLGIGVAVGLIIGTVVHQFAAKAKFGDWID